MKIKERLLDVIIHSRLFEMAYERDRGLKKLSNLQNQIDMHLLKILMYHENEAVSHWIGKANSWLHQVQNIILKKGKRFSTGTYKLYLWEHLLETIPEVQRHMNKIYEKYQLPPDQPDAQIIHKEAEQIMHNVCVSLSNDKFTDIRNYL